MAERLVADGAAFLTDPTTWISLAAALTMMIGSLGVGIVAGRRLGLLRPTSPSLNVFAVGLALGLLLLISWYATIRSLGRSSFVPAALLLAGAVLAGRHAVRPGLPRRTLIGVTAAALAVLFALATMYGTTIAPSPRVGVQPIENMDEAFYAVLGDNLQDTGTESVYAPAGLGDLEGRAPQAWYHWGEVWLAAAASALPGTTAMSARHVIALPIVILATVALVAAGAADLATGTGRREAAFLASIGMVGLSPVPLWPELHFDWWARPIGFSATVYGLSYLVVALALYLLMKRPRHLTSGSMTLLIAGLTACLVASHILIAAVAAVAVTIACGVLIAPRRGASRRFVEAYWPHLGAWVVGGTTALIWGFLTGHGLGGDPPVEGVGPFDDAWRRAMLLTALGGGVLIVGPVLALRSTRTREDIALLAAGAVGGTLFAAALWGWRLPDFNSFHVYYGAIAVILTPVATIALVAGVIRAKDYARHSLTRGLAIFLLFQGALGIGTTMQRLYEFGPGHYDPVPVAVLDEIKSLPEGARLAYSCDEIEEVAPWDARLISLTAHTGRPVVAMCFQVDVFGAQLGVLPPDLTRMNPFFASAPQRDLYPRSGAKPTTAEILAFLERYDIDFIYEDADHPNRLLPDARPRFSMGAVTIYEVP